MLQTFFLASGKPRTEHQHPPHVVSRGVRGLLHKPSRSMPILWLHCRPPYGRYAKLKVRTGGPTSARSHAVRED